MNWLKDKLDALTDDLKNAYKSFTILFNTISLVIIAALPQLQSSLPELQNYISPDIYKQFTLWLIIGNMILRFKTTKRLSDK